MLANLLAQLFPMRRAKVPAPVAPVGRGSAAQFAAFLGRRANLATLARQEAAKREQIVEREASAAAVKCAVAGERNRLAAILTSKEARGRTDAARRLAFETSTPAGEAVAALASMPTESGRERRARHFDRPAHVPASDPAAEAKALSAQILAAGDRVGVDW